MLILDCSAKARKRYKLKLDPDPEAPAGAWHERWRLDLLEGHPCGYGVIFTNLETLYTFLIPAAECASFDRLLAHFRMRLQFTLIDAGSNLKLNPTEPPAIVSLNPRSVIGTLLDMKRILDSEHRKGPNQLYRDSEDYLNHTPFGVIGYAYAIEKFYEKSAAHPSSGPSLS